MKTASASLTTEHNCHLVALNITGTSTTCCLISNGGKTAGVTSQRKSTCQFVAKFIKWGTTISIVNGQLQRPAVNLNTIGRDLKMLKAWTRVAFERGVHQNRAAWESKIMNVREVKTVKVHLTPDEINALATP